MKRSIPGCVLVLLPFVITPLSGQQKLDLSQQQSPPRPRPDWAQDHRPGPARPALKGYLTPEGIKVEIVADVPDRRQSRRHDLRRRRHASTSWNGVPGPATDWPEVAGDVHLQGRHQRARSPP